jgi:threonine synthase
MTATLYSALARLDCAKCGISHNADRVQGLCECGAPLLARYDIERLAATVSPADLAARPPDLWRYHELLPVRSAASVVTLGEGMTPLLAMRNIGRHLGVPALMMKDEGLIPTGTFKARGAAVGVSRAAELGLAGVAMPTNGNAGAAWAVYAARAGLASLIVMPAGAPAITRVECVAAGSELYLVDGLIGDAATLVHAALEARPGYQDVATLCEPYRLEGKKTMGLEIAEQLGWRLPDVIVYPTGGGVGIIGIFKAMQELRELGWTEGDLPRLVAVQSSGCAPIVEAFACGARQSEPWPDPRTVAFGLTVPKALGDFLVLDALYTTGGTAVAVDDDALLADQRELARLEGCFVCPEGAACFTAIRQLRESGWLSGGEAVVVLNTGSGLKYPGTVRVDVPVLGPGDDIPPPRGSQARFRGRHAEADHWMADHCG